MHPRRPAFRYLADDGVVDRLPVTVRLIRDGDVVDLDWDHLPDVRERMTDEDQAAVGLAMAMIGKSWEAPPAT